MRFCKLQLPLISRPISTEHFPEGSLLLGSPARFTYGLVANSLGQLLNSSNLCPLDGSGIVSDGLWLQSWENVYVVRRTGSFWLHAGRVTREILPTHQPIHHPPTFTGLRQAG